ncbi:MAG: site-specific integrase [Pseudomonadota bacterium]|nr:site-specific integrase [Pseudomonadota bacterium]
MAPMPSPSTTYVRRLGAHHFAHLRAAAEGLGVPESARRYLGVEHGHQARAAHQQTLDAVRAVARRRGESAWRLIGLAIRTPGASAHPSLEDFAAERGLEGWREDELRQMHAEAYPVDPKAARRQRLRARQLALLRRLENLAAEVPLASDSVAGWFDDTTASKLITAGMSTLGELQAVMAIGGRWYRTLPAVGPGKAQRIAAHLALLLPDSDAPRRVFSPGVSAASQAARAGLRPQIGPLAQPGAVSLVPAASQGAPRTDPDIEPTALAAAAQRPAPGAALLHAASDAQAVQGWIGARAGSVATARVYQREATRLLLWLEHEAGGKTLRQMSVHDCSAFMAFLQHIPPQWMSRARAAPGEPGWAPFRGHLSHQSQKQAVTINASLFAWLQAAQYVSANPWVLVNHKTGDDRQRKMLDTKALSEDACEAILRFIDAQPPSPARARIRFILRFVESVGLRSAELLGARLGDFRHENEGWVMQVHGKGAKNRIAAIPGQALEALQDYLAARGLGCIDTAPPEAPLLASTLEPMAAVGYQALYEHVRRWLAKAVRASSLSEAERAKLLGATTHWLRHTFGTRAIARDVPLDVIQAQMGHASIQTTTAIYGRAPIKRRVDALGKAFK